MLFGLFRQKPFRFVDFRIAARQAVQKALDGGSTESTIERYRQNQDALDDLFQDLDKIALELSLLKTRPEQALAVRQLACTWIERFHLNAETISASRTEEQRNKHLSGMFPDELLDQEGKSAFDVCFELAALARVMVEASKALAYVTEEEEAVNNWFDTFYTSAEILFRQSLDVIDEQDSITAVLIPKMRQDFKTLKEKILAG